MEKVINSFIAFAVNVSEIYTGIWNTNAPVEYADWAELYGWAGAASLIPLILVLILILLRRGNAVAIIAGTTQHVVLLGLPFMIGTLPAG